MNVGELKCEIENLPDDALVVIVSGVEEKAGYIVYASPRDAHASEAGTTRCAAIADLMKLTSWDFSKGLVLIVATSDEPTRLPVNDQEDPDV